MDLIHSHPEVSQTRAELLQTIHRLGQEIIAPAAASVDREARFPHEALTALRKESLLSAYVPQQYGGLGLSIDDLVVIAQTLSQYCASSAMVWAMHQIQVASIVHHGQSLPFFQAYLREMVEKQLLLASVTSEVGVGGNIRTSIAAVEHDEDTLCTLEKKSTAISYGEYADGFLVTARRNPTAAATDQVLLLLRREETALTKTGNWNTLGMRGTCSPAFTLNASFSAEQILPLSFGDIAAQTMVPFTHLIWSGCWQGIATDALKRAQKFLQMKARQQRVTAIPGDDKLVEGTAQLQLMRAHLQEAVREYADMLSHPEQLEDAAADMGYAIRLNNVKLLSSQLVVQIVQLALAVCGLAGYSEDSPFSVARHLRDAFSASLMISNERLYTTNAALLLIHKETY
ncbi:acyl-CoA dehydrogenase family protein [Tengunoibacter tsumagoiensis]|uniref:Acyl-CoA dehydrogenase n=1 Tax=Tengunoibacter tsumagoiensis TaxID=2014871 RepID=A0A402A135_9CHLR|nr:acyl-CoA dehydrogenase family protein [Tengunoibacter tsumagoiensis]GCE12858.1 acyl-CoA dehydrogenase [Tengunoibacter tsumagoiensis]